MENTVTEFWRMVWQEQASCIVMLTKTFDFIKVKGLIWNEILANGQNAKNYSPLKLLNRARNMVLLGETDIVLMLALNLKSIL